jgi:hypothetical protein
VGIGEAILYQSEFSPTADAALRKTLKTWYSSALASKLSIIRYSLDMLDRGIVPSGLSASDRKVAAALQKRVTEMAAIVGSFSDDPRSGEQGADGQRVGRKIQAAVRLELNKALWRSGRMREFAPQQKSTSTQGGLKIHTLKKVPDFFARAAGELDFLASALRVVQGQALPPGSPTQTRKNYAAVLIAHGLEAAGVGVTMSWNGVYARVLRAVLPEFGLSVPSDIGQFVRRSVTRAHDPKWSRNLFKTDQVLPLTDE